MNRDKDANTNKEFDFGVIMNHFRVPKVNKGNTRDEV